MARSKMSVLSLQGSDGINTHSDDSGFYRFENLTNGTYRIVPEMGRYHFKPESAVITLKNCDEFGVDFSDQFYTNPPQRPSNPNPSNFANNICEPNTLKRNIMCATYLYHYFLATLCLLFKSSVHIILRFKVFGSHFPKSPIFMDLQ
jgi:hypothetical protein